MRRRTRPEILAPAGSKESLFAALRCGADAVYAGGKAFSARQGAENFDRKEMADAVALCHLYGAKFYLAINTLVFDREFSRLEQFLKEAIDAGIDAVLVQDFGVLRFIRKFAPDLPIHASTQMTIHTPAGAAWAKRQGISRVVAARELSRPQLQALCSCGIEVESFVHGALCMSVSGQCGLSALIGARSANRGCCAQACRLPFTASSDKNACALSLKDLCLIPAAQQMAADGVASLKIEGRCKRPEYVAAAVTALRQTLDGETPDLKTLQAVFSRSGFTDGYYTGRRQDMFGTRRKEDVMQTKRVLPQLKQLYQRPPQFVPVRMQARLKTGKPAILTLTDDAEHMVSVTGDVLQKAEHKPTDAAQLTRQLEKLGGTIFTLDALKADCDGTCMLSASSLNELRRKGIAALEQARIQANKPRDSFCSFPPPVPDTPVSPPVSNQTAPVFRVWCADWNDMAASLLEKPETACLLLPIERVSAAIPMASRPRVYLTLPRFCPTESRLIDALKQAKALGFFHLVCENAAHLELGRRMAFTLHGGMGLNLLNCHGLRMLREERVVDSVLAPEMTIPQIKDCVGLPTGVYVYGHQPVMTCRNCPLQAEIGCSKCRHRLIDRTGRQFPVYCSKFSDTTTIYNAVPTWMADKLDDFRNVSFFLLDCRLCADPAAILNAYQNRLPYHTPMTRGLFYRGLGDSDKSQK